MPRFAILLVGFGMVVTLGLVAAMLGLVGVLPGAVPAAVMVAAAGAAMVGGLALLEARRAR